MPVLLHLAQSIKIVGGLAQAGLGMWLVMRGRARAHHVSLIDYGGVAIYPATARTRVVSSSL